jgi:hypothetical protein
MSTQGHKVNSEVSEIGRIHTCFVDDMMTAWTTRSEATRTGIGRVVVVVAAAVVVIVDTALVFVYLG